MLAFSMTGGTIPAGCGTLVNLSLDGTATGLSGIVVSDAAGSALPFVYYVGSDTELVADCTDEYPDCGANYYDCNDDCGGSAVEDECGECGGDGSSCETASIFTLNDDFSVSYESDFEIAGFQFNVNGADLLLSLIHI